MTQEANEQRDSSGKLRTSEIIKQQSLKLAEVLRTRLADRDALLSEERRCIDEVTSDRLAIEKMEEFNAKSRQNLWPDRKGDRPSCKEKRTVLEKSLILLDKPVEEWRVHLDAEQRQYHRMEFDIGEQRYRLPRT